MHAVPLFLVLLCFILSKLKSQETLSIQSEYLIAVIHILICNCYNLKRANLHKSN